MFLVVKKRKQQQQNCNHVKLFKQYKTNYCERAIEMLNQEINLLIILIQYLVKKI